MAEEMQRERQSGSGSAGLRAPPGGGRENHTTAPPLRATHWTAPGRLSGPKRRARRVNYVGRRRISRRRGEGVPVDLCAAARARASLGSFPRPQPWVQASPSSALSVLPKSRAPLTRRRLRSMAESTHRLARKLALLHGGHLDGSHARDKASGARRGVLDAQGAWGGRALKRAQALDGRARRGELHFSQRGSI